MVCLTFARCSSTAGNSASACCVTPHLQRERTQKPLRNLHLCFRSHCKHTVNWALLQETWNSWKSWRKDIFVLAIRSLQQLKANPVLGGFNPRELRETRGSNLWHFLIQVKNFSRSTPVTSEFWCICVNLWALLLSKAPGHYFMTGALFIGPKFE